MTKSIAGCVFFLVIQAFFGYVFPAGQQHSATLLPNGGLEQSFVNDIEQLPDYRTRIHPNGRGYVPYWELSAGAAASADSPQAGARCLELVAGEKEVSASLRSDFWNVKDPAMPFGLPIVPGTKIKLSFFYRTSDGLKAETLKCLIKLGTVAGLPSETREFTLSPVRDWQRYEVILETSSLKWGAEVRFVLSPGEDGARAWIDEVEMYQEVNLENLVSNHSFEELDPTGLWPSGWQKPGEDQWVSWVGSSYRLPFMDDHESVSGGRSVRASVSYGEGSGLSQRVPLKQKAARPIIVTAWSKLDNSIGNSPPGYWGPNNLANLTVFVHFNDGTMQEISPTFSLGISDHDWEYRRFGFQPQKPVEEIELRFTVLGSEPTTSLFLDEITAGEWNTGRAELIKRSIAVPPRSLAASWGRPARIEGGTLLAANDEDSLYLLLPTQKGVDETLVFLNPRIRSDFLNYRRFLFYTLRIKADGTAHLAEMVEKQGYQAEGSPIEARLKGIEIMGGSGGRLVRIPFRSLGARGDYGEAFGFNVAWKKGRSSTFWNGKTAGTRDMGTIYLARPLSIRIKSLLFGRRYYEETDQSQDFVSHPQLYAGLNQAEVVLLNEGDSVFQGTLLAGVRGEKSVTRPLRIDPGKSESIRLEYDAGSGKTGLFELSIETTGKRVMGRSYPLVVPPAVEIVLDQEFYFPEEKEAVLEVHNRRRPIVKGGRVRVEIDDLLSRKVVLRFERPLATATAAYRFDIQNLRINELPVQDYELRLVYLDAGGRELGGGRAVFGRINHTRRRPLPPIRKLAVDSLGRLIINDDFRFFPVVPSVNVMDWDEAIKLGANTYRSSYAKNSRHFEETDRAWAVNAYVVTIGPGSPDPDFPDILERFREDAPRLLSHPGFLSCYGKQFYYWKLPQDLIEYRKRLQNIVAALPAPRLIIWGHHDSSFLYDKQGPVWRDESLPVGYCYVKIMGRPGPMWRNTPFLTKTERILSPNRFLLAEVNYYVSFHSDEVVPEQYPGYLSLRGDDWRGVRAESYLAVIYGANGLYHWVCTQKHQLQRLRGWFQELNFMWPIFVADDAPERVEVTPAGADIEVRFKQWNGKHYLLAANAGETAQNAEITIPGWTDLKVTKFFEVPGNMSVSGSVIRDTWDRYGVHVYEITR